MGSYCSLKFDDLEVTGFKSTVPEVFISLFQEADRRVQQICDNPDDPQSRVAYIASRDVVLHRLDLLGITADAASAAFNEWISGELEMHREWAEQGSERVDPALAALETLTYTAWSARVPGALRNQFTLQSESACDEVERHMLDHQDGWLLFAVDEDRQSARPPRPAAATWSRRRGDRVTISLMAASVHWHYPELRGGAASRPLLKVLRTRNARGEFVSP
jgi:hypothetical protein